MRQIELSIIIPTMNEELSLPTALASIARQQQIEIEIIVADGGSTDLTQAVALGHHFQKISFVSTVCDKAEQLNLGATQAVGEYLLFMHADCSFPDDQALRKGVDSLAEAQARSGNKRFAGHFRLKFERNSTAPSLGYTYYERKASLNRPGCAHGDQGILLSRKMFAEHGAFSTSCPLLAETRLADQLREKGQWLLIPADILTSARRFEKEGLKERQILNAVILALDAAGMDQTINGIPQIYWEQSQSKSLEIYPMLLLVREKITALSREERRIFWLRIGVFVRDNAWQIPFFLDVKREYGSNGIIEDSFLYWLDRFERFCSTLICSRPGTYCACLITKIWFKFMLLRVGEKD